MSVCVRACFLRACVCLCVCRWTDADDLHEAACFWMQYLGFVGNDGLVPTPWPWKTSLSDAAKAWKDAPRISLQARVCVCACARAACPPRRCSVCLPPTSPLSSLRRLCPLPSPPATPQRKCATFSPGRREAITHTRTHAHTHTHTHTVCPHVRKRREIDTRTDTHSRYSNRHTHSHQ